MWRGVSDKADNQVISRIAVNVRMRIIDIGVLIVATLLISNWHARNA